MNLPHFKTFMLVAPALLALGACHQNADSQNEGAVAVKPGVSVTGGVLTLPVIKGNPGAAYFTVANHGKATATIAAIDIDGALKVEIHDSENGVMSSIDQVPVKPGQDVKFSPGARHAMAFDLDSKLAAGGKTQMTLTFDDGSKVSAPLKITATGADAMGDMPGMGSPGHS